MHLPTLRNGLFVPACLLLLNSCASDDGVTVFNTAPTVSITTPANGTEFDEGTSITFQAYVDDDLDYADELTLTWQSDIDDILVDDGFPDGNGSAQYSTANLSPGNHVITLTAVDSQAASGSDTVDITVIDVPDAPEITILSPIAGELGVEDEEYEFGVYVTDEQDEPEDLYISFSSNVDGLFCEPVANISGVAECDAVLSYNEDGHYLEFTVEDSEGYASSASMYFYIQADAEIDDDGDGYTENQDDCDDTDSSVHPNAEEYYNGVDDDCDGEIDEDTVASDDDGDGQTELEGDCDDTDDDTYEGAEEVCDGIDNDCDGDIDEGTSCVDDDGDGYTELDGDCDDTSTSIYPGATESEDGLDNDCDGYTDEGTGAYDDDGDCYCESATCLGSINTSCTSVVTGDCDDTDDAISPDATEMCDGVDNDCDSDIDEDDAADADTWYLDDDEDSFGDEYSTQTACSQPSGYVADDTDCDDTDADINPDATEVCDYVDNNCDGSTDEGVTTEYYRDDDGDTYGDASSTTAACSVPSGYTTNAEDCDDTDDTINPDGEEVCDGNDNNCDGDTDEDSASDASTWYLDDDGDGYGSEDDTYVSCSAPSGYLADDSDCDDTDDTINPDADEVCDYVDNDCDGSTDEGDALDASVWYEDADGDSYGDTATATSLCWGTSGYVANDEDCNDGDDDINPAASETCDSIDNNCDGDIDEGVTTTYYADDDGDGYGDPATSADECSLPSGYTTNADDCDDSDDDLNPDTIWYLDYDSDGYGSAYYTSTSCTQPSGYVSNYDDCNDSTDASYPGATESCDGDDNDCDGDTDEANASGCSTYYYDYDGDGYGSTASQCLCDVTGYYTSSNNNDCYDYNANANPAQGSYFTSNRGDGSYDYNCDGSESKYYTARYDCDYDWTGFSCDSYTNGWSGSSPSCGSSGTWKSGCSASWWSCTNTSSSSMAQYCN